MNFLKKLFEQGKDISCDDGRDLVDYSGKDIGEDAVEELMNESETVVDDEAVEEGEASVCGEEKPIRGYTLEEIAEICEDSEVPQFVADILSEEFALFSKGRSGSLAEKHGEFIRFKGLVAKDAASQSARGETGQKKREHSGFSGASQKDYTQSLNARQMEIARSAGMSFKEYAELLSAVPAKTRNKI